MKYDRNVEHVAVVEEMCESKDSLNLAQLAMMLLI